MEKKFYLVIIKNIKAPPIIIFAAIPKAIIFPNLIFDLSLVVLFLAGLVEFIIEVLPKSVCMIIDQNYLNKLTTL